MGQQEENYSADFVVNVPIPADNQRQFLEKYDNLHPATRTEIPALL